MKKNVYSILRNLDFKNMEYESIDLLIEKDDIVLSYLRKQTRLDLNMAWWWPGKGGNKKPEDGESNSANNNNNEEIHDDLANYLDTRESQLSNREFKALLRRQSANAEESKKAEKEANGGMNVETQQGGDFLSMIQAKNANADSSNDQEKKELDLPKLPSGLTTTNSMKKPHEYQDFEIEKYRRENDEKEIVLTNCSEIQHAFYDCLGKQTIWDRVTAVAKLDSDECTKLADFFIACTEIQKKAFLMFDYATLDSIDEMRTCANKIDGVFNQSFKNVDDVREKQKFLEYTKQLRTAREDFFTKYGK